MLRGTFLLRTTLIGAFLFLLTFPYLPLNLWVIPLVISFFGRPLERVLLLSLAVGALLDLLGSHHPVGIYAICCVATSALLYRWRRHFFEDSVTTVPLLTALYSSLFSSALLLLLPSTGLGGVGYLTDLVLMPIADGIAAFFLVVVPRLLLSRGSTLPDQAAAHRPR